MAIAYIAGSANITAGTFNPTSGFSLSPNATIPVGSTVVVGLQEVLANNITSVTDSGGNSYVQEVNNTTFDSVASVQIWVCASSTAQLVGGTDLVTVKATTASAGVLCVLGYSGVQAIGTTAINSSSIGSTSPTISLTTQDANNFVVAVLAVGGVRQTWSANTGNLRASFRLTGGRNMAVVDNTAASPSSVTCSATISSSNPWDCAAVELRSTTGVTVIFTRRQRGWGY